MADINHPNYVAARKATQDIYKVEPDLTREGTIDDDDDDDGWVLVFLQCFPCRASHCAGGSIPITLIFEEETKKNIVLLPMGRSDDGAHSQNEKLDRRWVG